MYIFTYIYAYIYLHIFSFNHYFIFAVYMKFIDMNVYICVYDSDSWNK